MLDVLMASSTFVLLIMVFSMIYLLQLLKDTIAYQSERINYYRQEALTANHHLRLDKRDA